MATTFSIARKLHRMLILIMLTLGLFMAMTGMALKYTWAASLLGFLDITLIRFLHNSMSTYFGIALFCMILTGTWMYFYPAVKKRQRKPITTPQPQSEQKNSNPQSYGERTEGRV